MHHDTSKIKDFVGGGGDGSVQYILTNLNTDKPGTFVYIFSNLKASLWLILLKSDLHQLHSFYR